MPRSPQQSLLWRSALAWTVWLGVTVSVKAARPVAEEPVSFRRDVMAVLAKAGCASGPCHGNRNGKGGFKLSLRGEDPATDYATLINGLAGRRLDFTAPADSLLLLKPTTDVAHEGGARLKKGSREYEILRRWIAARSPDDASAPKLTRLEVTPRDDYYYAPRTNAQITATAVFADGLRRDVTTLAVYEVSNVAVAEVAPDGRVMRKSDGETTVLVRYLDQQAPVRLAFVPRHPEFAARKFPQPANAVDEQVYAKLKQLRLNPAGPCTDEVFLRRAYLDLLGILPTADDARAFVADTAKDKRAKLVDTLLERPEFAESWAMKWADLLRLDERTLDRKGARLFYDWLRTSIASHEPIDQFARKLVSARGSTYANPAANYYRNLRTPVERAEAAAQVWLGTRLQCAQCHNHPYERWTQDNYHDWTALFERVDFQVLENRRQDENDSHEFKGEQVVFVKNSGEHQNPRTKKTSVPRFLGVPTPVGEWAKQNAALVSTAATPSPLNGERGAIASGRASSPSPHPTLSAPSGSGEGKASAVPAISGIAWPTNAITGPTDLDALAAWLTSTNNPLFARSQANRIWFHLMGRGLVDPIDDFRSTNPASHPALLDVLTAELAKSGYDLRHVIRLVMSSRTYQASSEPTKGSEDDMVNYSHNIVRRLTAEQLLDAQSEAAGVPLEFAGFPDGTRAGQMPLLKTGARRKSSPLDQFLVAFGKPPRQTPSECERSSEPTMTQAFALISGPTVQDFIGEKDNRLAPLLASGKPAGELVNELFWNVLTRAPSQPESEKLVALLDTAPNKRAALEDILWGLLNAKEFVLRK